MTAHLLRLGARLSAMLNKGDRPLRYLLAGGINTVFGTAIFPILLWSSDYLHQHYMIGLVIAQGLSLTFAFCTYKLTVFKTRANLIREFAKFSGFYLTNYAVNLLALPLMVEILKLPPIVSQLIFSVILIAGGYFWHSRVTFTTR